MKSTKKFFILAFLFCASCGFWQTAENKSAGVPQIGEEVNNGFPFESREPDRFQTEIVVTNFSGGDEKSEKKYFAARTENKSLTVFDYGEKSERAVLNDGAKTVFIDKEKKMFSESANSSNAGFSSDEMSVFLTTEWLNRKTDANFEKLQTENNLTKYNVRLGDSSGSEIVLIYDENLKIPVKQEFYSISGAQRILTMTVELKNFQASADEKLFVLPQDYKRAETK